MSTRDPWVKDQDLLPIENSHDKSFIIVLDRMAKQAINTVRNSEPCVESQHDDGIKIGRLYMIQEVIRAYREFK